MSLLPSDLDRDLDAALVHAGVPDSLHEGLVNYLRFGLPPGSCLQAILQNDLKEACFKADPVTELRLRQIVIFLATYAPWECWGSLEAYEHWIAQGTARHRQACPLSEGRG